MPRVIRLPIICQNSIANAATRRRQESRQGEPYLGAGRGRSALAAPLRSRARRVTLAPCAAPAEIRRGHKAHAAAEGHTPWPPQRQRARRPGAHATRRMPGGQHRTLIIAPLACQHNLQSPHAKMLSRRNPNVLPFDDASSLEFLMQKNNCGMFAVASHSKKRPDNLTLVSFAGSAPRRSCARGV